MNEEIMNVENEEVIGEVVDTYEELENSGKGLLGTIVAGVVLVGAGAVLAYKNRDKLKKKRTEKLIRKLEDQGYKVTEPEPIEGEMICSEEEAE